MVSDEREPMSWEEIHEQPLPRYALEESLVGRLWLLDVNEPLYPQSEPESELQALMEAEPHAEPRVPQGLQLDAVDGLSDRIDRIVETSLSEEERAVVEVTVFAGHSVRKASEILGWPKSTIHRLKLSALRVIERELRDVEE